MTACLKDRQYACKRNIEALSCNHSGRGKAVNVSFSECVPLAFVIQNEMRMRRIILSSVACLALPYFSTLSHKRHDLGKQLLKTKYVLIFFTTFV
jgi:hypothetical protein